MWRLWSTRTSVLQYGMLEVRIRYVIELVDDSLVLFFFLAVMTVDEQMLIHLDGLLFNCKNNISIRPSDSPFVETLLPEHSGSYIRRRQ